MPTNNYFNNFGAINEQRLVEDIIVESIKIMGTDAYYLPNNNDAARDLLYGEDPLKKFTSAFPVEIYPENVMDYGGDKELFSKFGLEIKNQITVILSKRSFSQRVPQSTFNRPREGDLLYIPFLNGTGELYEIKFTNQTKDFFMLGRKTPYFYELELEKFKYSQEVIDTGISDIDDIVMNSGYTIDLSVNSVSGNGSYQSKEIIFQSEQEDLNLEFSNSRFIVSLIERLISRQGKLFVLAWTSTNLFINPKAIILGPKPGLATKFDNKIYYNGKSSNFKR